MVQKLRHRLGPRLGQHWAGKNDISSFELVFLTKIKGFPGGSAIRNLPAMQEMQETWVQFLGQEDCLEEERATHSNILAWKIPWTEEPGGLQFITSQRQLSTHAPKLRKLFL